MRRARSTSSTRASSGRAARNRASDGSVRVRLVDDDAIAIDSDQRRRDRMELDDAGGFHVTRFRSAGDS